MNRNVTFVRGADPSITMELEDRSALRRLLAEHFAFDLPEVESLAVPAILGEAERPMRKLANP